MKIKKLFTLVVVLSALLGAWQVGPTSAGEPLPQGEGTITAHKFEDVDGNGVQDEGEEDIGGWVFQLYLLDGVGIWQVAEGSTDSDGVVTFTDVPSGRYKVWEELPECWEPTTPGKRWNGGYYRVVDLHADEQLALDFGNVAGCEPPPPPPPPPPTETCIKLRKTGPETADPGQEIAYHFKVKNCGDVVLQGGAQVYDPLFGDGPIWDGDLEPGEIVEFDETYTLPVDHCGDFTNDAWAVGHPPGYPEVRDDDSWTVEIICAGCPDADGDGVCDDEDNCPGVYNPDQADADGDGAGDACDGCPSDPDKTEPGVCGCGVPDVDSDGDGTLDCNDGCPDDPNKTAPGFCGCGVPDVDNDGDGTYDCDDLCPDDPDKTAPGACGCGVPDTDSDGDGTPDCNDDCPNDPAKTEPGICGCGVADTDSDGDGTADCNDGCPDDPNKTVPGVCGCGVADTDSDGDGTLDCMDDCPNDPDKTDPGVCGCGVADTDSDGDGTADCNDGCPDDPDKAEPGACGCGVPDTDSDGDGVPDCNDNCPDTANPGQEDSDGDGVGDACDDDGWDHSSLYFDAGCDGDCDEITATVCNGDDSEDMEGTTTWELYWIVTGNPQGGTVIASGTINALAAGECQVLTYDPGDNSNGASGNYMFKAYQRPGHPGQGVLWSDACELECPVCADVDQDGVCDDEDNCPDVYNPDQADADGDGVGDACDGCPDDPDKTDPGICGCGVADTDSDGDGTADCNDGCPDDPDKIEPGVCGCGVADTDSDGDGAADCNDNCPDDPDKTEPGACGCGVADTDSDGDGTPDCNDNCPNDPAKTEPGVCGCGVLDVDSDGDGTLDCQDGCPNDPDKTDPGVCGCGTPDTDTDGDGTPDCIDGCSADPNKTDPGVCGCGTPDTDTDGDGIADCIDNCPDTYNPGQEDTDGDGTGDACEVGEPCIELTKLIDGPYRTADDLFLTDGIIPVAAQSDNNPNAYGGENYFYFYVEITVENCGGTELTGVVVEDSFSNEAQPFETDDPGNVTITPPSDPYNGMVHESLTWSVGAIPVGGSRTLHIKVGTESNSNRLLEPTSAPQTIFYNGRNDDTGSASVTADGGLGASVGAMAISNGPEINCVASVGEWYNLIFTAGPHVRPHDKCTQVTTSLPIMLTDSDGSGLITTSTSSPLQRAAPVAAAAATVTAGLGSVAWWVLRQRLLGVLFP